MTELQPPLDGRRRARPTCSPSRWTRAAIDPGPGEAAGGEPALLGDIVLCPEVAGQAGRARPGTRTADELHLLTVHGVLHLLGYDHAEPDEEREMFGLQAKLLDGWRAGAARAVRA